MYFNSEVQRGKQFEKDKSLTLKWDNLSFKSVKKGGKWGSAKRRYLLTINVGLHEPIVK